MLMPYGSWSRLYRQPVPLWGGVPHETVGVLAPVALGYFGPVQPPSGTRPISIFHSVRSLPSPR